MKERPLLMRIFNWALALGVTFFVSAFLYVAHLALNTDYIATKQKQFALALQSSPSTALRSELFSSVLPADSREWLELTDLLKSVDRGEYTRARQLSESSVSEALVVEERDKVTKALQHLEELEQKVPSLQIKLEAAQEESNSLAAHGRKSQKLAALQTEYENLQEEQTTQLQTLKTTLTKNILDQVHAPVPTATYYIYQLVREGAREVNKELPEIRSAVVPSPPSWYYSVSRLIKPSFEFMQRIHAEIAGRIG